MNTIFSQMVVSLQVMSIKKKDYKATVKAGFVINGKKETVTLKNVSISGLLIHCIEDTEKTKYELKKEYTAENNSKNYEACPIRLIRACNVKTGEMYYSLRRLNEGKSKVSEILSPKGTPIKHITFTSIPQSKWMRYSDYYAKGRKVYEDELASKQPA